MKNISVNKILTIIDVMNGKYTVTEPFLKVKSPGILPISDQSNPITIRTTPITINILPGFIVLHSFHNQSDHKQVL